MTQRLAEYLKAIVAGVTVAVLTTVANVTDAVEANIDPVQQAVAALVTAVLVAVFPNRQPTAKPE